MSDNLPTIRNTLLNILGQSIPLIVGLASFPFILRGIGIEQFGILTFAWAILGYFTLFDLGIGRAATKFVAEYINRREDQQLPAIIWTSLAMQLIFGVAGGLIIGYISPVLAQRILLISPALVEETTAVFIVLAASLPVLLIGNSLRGVLEAVQRFDLLNFVRMLANTSIFLVPALAWPYGLRLRTIVMLIVVAKFLEMLSYLAFTSMVVPNLWRNFRLDRKLVHRLASFGGWVTVTNVVGPLLTYADRFLIGALNPMSAVAYYTVPYEAVTKLWIIPSSLVATLFPAFSNLNASGSLVQMKLLCVRSLKSLLILMGPILSVVVFFSDDLLHLWLGPDFAASSSMPLKILALGVLINSLAMVPCAFLQAIGRPDLPAKFHLFELPIYILVLWILVSSMGITGAALAWTLRVSLDAMLLFGTAIHLRLASGGFSDKGFRNAIFMVLACAGLIGIPTFIMEELLYRILITLVIVPLFWYGTWRFVLDQQERIRVATAINHMIPVFWKAE